jgi:hypothetical protein
LVEYDIPAQQPLAGVISIIPSAGGTKYALHSGPAVPNGDVVARSAFLVNINLPGDVPTCTVPVSSTGFNLLDGAIPFYGGAGEGPDDASLGALTNPAVWPTRVEASALFKAFDPNGTAARAAPGCEPLDCGDPGLAPRRT